MNPSAKEEKNTLHLCCIYANCYINKRISHLNSDLFESCFTFTANIFNFSCFYRSVMR